VTSAAAAHAAKFVVIATLLGGTQDTLRTAKGQENSASRPGAVREGGMRETATFGGGCFWCTEAVFERVKGVEKVRSGYSGGTVENPTYQQVCTGLTGHAEAVQIEFDPAVISYADLLEIFWKTHDPTTLNQQGPDKGPQYRSAVFYHSDQQRETAEAYKRQLDESKAFKKPIVTEITQYTNFFEAEPYHQDYFELNRRQPYCSRYISPKIKKFNRMFRDKLKEPDAAAREGE
jgi:peptide-methionine (S)-S-oxide reductase